MFGSLSVLSPPILIPLPQPLTCALFVSFIALRACWQEVWSYFSVGVWKVGVALETITVALFEPLHSLILPPNIHTHSVSLGQSFALGIFCPLRKLSKATEPATGVHIFTGNSRGSRLP